MAPTARSRGHSMLYTLAAGSAANSPGALTRVSADCYIIGREHLEGGDWRIACASAEGAARVLEGGGEF